MRNLQTTVENPQVMNILYPEEEAAYNRGVAEVLGETLEDLESRVFDFERVDEPCAYSKDYKLALAHFKRGMALMQGVIERMGGR